MAQGLPQSLFQSRADRLSGEAARRSRIMMNELGRCEVVAGARQWKHFLDAIGVLGTQ